MGKVIITGVTGMDGSNMADYLLANTDHEIIGMVRRLSVPNHGNLKSFADNPRFSLKSADLSDSVSIQELIKEVQPDYFLNFAAQSFVGESWNTPENTFDIDAMGVLRCLESIRRYAPCCRFYSAGSSEEFGDVVYAPQDEAHPIRPRSPYGASKAAARHIVKVYRDSYGIYACHGVLFNHEGMRRGEEFVTRKITKGVARIAKAFFNGDSFEPIELGNVDAKRDWSDSEDFVEGVWRMMNQEKYRYDLMRLLHKNNGDLLTPCAKTQLIAPFIKEYILASGETHSIRDFLKIAFETVDIATQWQSSYWMAGGDPLQDFLHGWGAPDYKFVTINPKFYRPAEVELLQGNSSEARKDLLWHPQTSFPKLVEKMVQNDLHYV